MILFLLSSFASSIYVPFQSTLLPAVTQLNSTSFEDFKPEKKILVTLILKDSAPLEQQSITLLLFSTVIPLFSHLAEFAFFRSNELPKELQKAPINPPSICVFFDKKLAILSPLPKTESAFVFFLNSWINPEGELVQTKEQLNQYLAGVPLALLVREGADVVPKMDENPLLGSSLYMKAIAGLSEALPFIDTCVVIRVSDVFMTLLDIDNPNPKEVAYFAIYKAEDHSIIPLPNSGKLTNDIYKATKPFYSQLNDLLISRSDDVMAAYILPSDEQNAVNENGELFIKYGISTNPKYNNDFRFVVSTENSNRFISQILRKEVHGPDFVVFSYYDGYYYPHDGSLTNLSIKDEKWKQTTESYLDSIVNKTIDKKFFSEAVPSPKDQKIGKGLYKLVGSTYKDFVSNPNKDVCILYIDDKDNEESFNFISALNDTVNDIFDGMTDEQIDKAHLSFGFININENSSPLHYPLIIGVPQFMLFPAKNKTDFRFMFYNPDQMNINRFLNESITMKPPKGYIDCIPMDGFSANMESFYFSMKYRNLPPVYQPLGNKMISKFRYYMSKGPRMGMGMNDHDHDHQPKDKDYDDL